MTNPAESEASPMLDEETRQFVRCAIASGLLQLEDIKKVVASMMLVGNSFSPDTISEHLVGASMLTRWQAQKLLSGRNRGFYLGSYKLLRPLGKGGMGVVYLGEHDVMKRLMALKILPPQATENPQKIQRFKQEARVAAQLDHDNIVRAYDFSESSGKMYLVMEFVDGIDLLQAVLRDGTMSVPAALDIMAQTANGLAHAHDRGIVHRDIKPSNLLLRTDGVIKISDMGLARIGWSGSEIDQNKKMMGTTDYLAPEQAIDSSSVDVRSDLYSLGCTVYFLLTGKPPFTGETPTHVLAMHQTTPPPDVRKECPACPAGLAELLLRSMAKRPDDRPNSAVEMLTWIQRLGGSDSARQQLSQVAPASDTVIDQTAYQATLDDTSLSSGGAVASVTEVEELDLSVMPSPASLDSLAFADESLPTLPAVSPVPSSSTPAVAQSPEALLDGLPASDPFATPEPGLGAASPSMPFPDQNASPATNSPAKLPSSVASRPSKQEKSSDKVGSNPVDPRILFGALAAVAAAVIVGVFLYFGGGDRDDTIRIKDVSRGPNGRSVTFDD